MNSEEAIKLQLLIMMLDLKIELINFNNILNRPLSPSPSK